MGELLIARITIHYYKGSDINTIHSITDNFKYFTNNALSSDSRLLWLKSYIVMHTSNNRHIPLNLIHSIGIELEWYNYIAEYANIVDFISLGNTINRSVWAGLNRDSLPFQVIDNIAKGDTHNIHVEKRLYRDFSNLEIAIKPVNIQVLDNKDKVLVDNTYYPPHINNPT